MKVNFHNHTNRLLKKEQKTIKKIFNKIKNKASMEIIFVDDEEITSINNEYRQINAKTDVLSFPSDEHDSVGDIFISIKTAAAQAFDYGHSIDRELGFLSVHGYLHLIGYDHQTEIEEKEMFLIQETILKQAGLERRRKNENE